MITGEQFFIDEINKIKAKYQELNPSQFDNPVDYTFKKASLEAEMQAYQSCMVEYKKYAIAASTEEAAIMIHQFCLTNSDKCRISLGEVERLEHQEDEKITADRGRFNGLIDGHNAVRVHFDLETSQYAAQHERTRNRK